MAPGVYRCRARTRHPGADPTRPTEPPEFMPVGGPSGDVNVLREPGSGRLRASVRAVLPTVATLAALLALAVPLGAVLPSADEASVVEGLLNLLAQSAR